MLFNLSQRDKIVHTFSKIVCSEVNVIARPELELTNYVVIVQYVNHDATGEPSHVIYKSSFDYYIYECKCAFPFAVS